MSWGLDHHHHHHHQHRIPEPFLRRPELGVWCCEQRSLSFSSDLVYQNLEMNCDGLWTQTAFDHRFLSSCIIAHCFFPPSPASPSMFYVHVWNSCEDIVKEPDKGASHNAEHGDNNNNHWKPPPFTSHLQINKTREKHTVTKPFVLVFTLEVHSIEKATTKKQLLPLTTTFVAENNERFLRNGENVQ